MSYLGGSEFQKCQYTFTSLLKNSYCDNMDIPHTQLS